MYQKAQLCEGSLSYNSDLFIALTAVGFYRVQLLAKYQSSLFLRQSWNYEASAFYYFILFYLFIMS